MPPEDLLDLFAIDPAATDVPAAGRPEPVLPEGPLLVEFGELERLDPARAAAAPEAPPPATRRRLWPFGLAGSIGVHLLPLLVLLAWHGSALELPAPIPVKLVVLEEPPAPPPPPPPPKAEEAKPPPPGRLANIDIGDPAAKPEKPAAAAHPADQPDETSEVAAALPRPKPTPPRELVSALPKPHPASPSDLKPPEPEQAPLVKPPAKQAVAAQLMPSARPARHLGQVPGPDATRDEYLAYCMSLVRQHYGLLPASFLAGRRGATALNILVLGDGTIAHIEFVQHSDYRDIDSRVEQMIAAVRRFPPLPQWIQRTSITMTYELAFPEGLLER